MRVKVLSSPSTSDWHPSFPRKNVTPYYDTRRESIEWSPPSNPEEPRQVDAHRSAVKERDSFPQLRVTKSPFLIQKLHRRHAKVRLRMLCELLPPLRPLQLTLDRVKHNVIHRQVVLKCIPS